MTRQIPQDVYDVMNSHNDGFDKMYFKFLQDDISQPEAFVKCKTRIREYFPKYIGYSSYHSYIVTRNRRFSKMLNRNQKTKFNR